MIKVSVQEHKIGLEGHFSLKIKAAEDGCKNMQDKELFSSGNDEI